MEQNYLRSLFSSSSSTMFSLSLYLFLLTSIVNGREIIPAIFTFGDSFADQGNNNYLDTTSRSNHLPYGKDFIGKNHPTGRFSNGKTFADLIGAALGIKEFVPPYLNPNLKPEELLTGVSFGSAASGYDPQTTASKSVLSMSKQLELFKEYIARMKGDEFEYILSNGIFLVIAGTVDISSTYFTAGERRSQYSIDSYADFLVQIASKFVEDLYALGARRVQVFGVPPIGCLPLRRTLKGGILRDCSNEENEASRLYNNKLFDALTIINNNLSITDSKANVAYVDLYNPLYDLVRHYTENGFAVADRGCCGAGFVEISIWCNPKTPTCDDDTAYLFWDVFHPTEHGYTVLVNRLLKYSFKNFL